MAWRDPKTGAYEQSGRHAAFRMNAHTPGNFVDLLHPDAMARRAHEVRLRGASQVRWGFCASAGIAVLSGLLMLRGVRGMTSTMEDLGMANLYMLGGFACLGLAYVSMSFGLEGRRLVQLSVKLGQRAQMHEQRHQHQPAGSPEKP